MKTSDKGLQFITKHEGCVLRPYFDQARILTVGVGHRLYQGDPYNRIITKDEAQELLRADVGKAEGAINKALAVTISQNQFDALVSFTFNVGNEAFKNSTLLRKLNNGDFRGAASEFLKWDKITVGGKKIVSDGLRTRRIDEMELFLRPDGDV